MSTRLVVELTSDEQKLLDGFRKAAAADDNLRAGYKKTGQAGKDAGTDIVTAMVDAGKKSAGSMKQLINEMKRTGDAGRTVGKDIDESFAGMGVSGKRSIGEIFNSIQRLSPEVAEQARKSIREWEAVDKSNRFDATKKELASLGGEFKTLAAEIDAGLSSPMEASQKRAHELVETLRDIDPARAQGIAAAMERTAQSIREMNMRDAVEAMSQLGEEGKISADKIKQELNDADAQAKFDESMMSLTNLGKEGQESAEKIRKAFAESKKEANLNELLRQLESVGDEGKTVAEKLKIELGQAADDSAASMESVIKKIREIDPTAADSAESIRSEIEQAATNSKIELDSMIDKLKSMGPVGKQVAEKLEADIQASAQAAESDIGNIIKKIDKIDPAVAKNARSIHTEIEKNAKKGAGSMTRFKNTAVSELKSVAGAYVGIHEAIQLIITLNNLVKESNRDAFEGIKQTKDGDRRLLQVSKDEEDFQALRQRADGLASEHGLGRSEARDLMFSARSEGFEDTVDFIAGNEQVISVDAQARVAGQVPGLFKKEAITGKQAINATLAGATESRLSFEEISGSLPSASEGAAMAGASLDETLGALSVLAGRFKSGDTAADRIKAFATRVALDTGNESLGRKSLSGTGIMSPVDQVETMSFEQRSDFLGSSQEVNAGYQILLEERDAIKAAQARIRIARESTGTANSPTAVKRRAAASDPKLRELKSVQISENKLEISREERRAVEEAMRQRKANDSLTGLETDGTGPVRIAAAELISDAASGFGVRDTSGLINVVGGNDFAGLVRDLNLSADAGDEEAKASLLAVTKLQADRRFDPKAMVSRDSAAEFLTATTGEQYLPGEMDDDVRSMMTKSIDDRATGSRGMYRDMVVSIMGGLGGRSNPLMAPFVENAAAEGEVSAGIITQESLEAIKQKTTATDRSKAIESSVLKFSQADTANTSAEISRTNGLMVEPIKSFAEVPKGAPAAPEQQDWRQMVADDAQQRTASGGVSTNQIEESTARNDTAQKHLEATERQTAAIERSNELQTKILETTAGTQANTKPKPARPGETQRAAVAIANNRKSQ